MRYFSTHKILQPHWWLILWVVIGASCRFWNLTAKPVWIDEFATMVFSLGHRFTQVPINRVISLDELIAPLKIAPVASSWDVAQVVVTDDLHPPIYFVLANWWLHLFPATPDGYLSVWVARSLPAIFGVISILGMYLLGKVAFKSELVAQLAAAFIAVSPYGIFIAQEARHYTLGVLLIIASLICLAIALHHLSNSTSIPIWWVLRWIVINILALFTHYFASISLAAQGLVLLWLLVRQWLYLGAIPPFNRQYWFRIILVALGTGTGVIGWIKVWVQNYDSQLSAWIKGNPPFVLWLINPIVQLAASIITMLCLLPVEAPQLWIIIASGLVMLLFLLWILPLLNRGLKYQWKEATTGLIAQAFTGFVGCAIALFWLVTYVLGYDITRGARYSFAYFPGVILLIAISLAGVWRLNLTQTRFIKQKWQLPINSRQAIVIVWIMGLLGAMTVSNNLGYRKYYQPELFIPQLQTSTSSQILIATTHNTLIQTGEMMGIAWEWRRTKGVSQPPQFLLAHQDTKECVSYDCEATKLLQATVAKIPKPLDLWLVNFNSPKVLDEQKCINVSQGGFYGYGYEHFQCGTAQKS
ncbi:glycosyltransferase family 39 protein [Merismopedia glauca]|uniref:glycosyltransferase family 39 protein n=1 Tax=Merismopedia glauca TaxID=292586 RepID=UPI0011B25500|nr:glycosyltransferase family 39 protein [Merismopedia glauca]